MKKRKLLKISAAGIPILLIGIMVYLYFSFREKQEKTEALKNIPGFQLTTISGTSFSSDDMMDGAGIKVLLYFSPGCHFCQAEAEELSKKYQNYKNVRWIWVASEPLDEIRQFARHYQLDKKDHIFWCHDEQAVLYRKLGISSIPYFLIYDRNNRLIKRNPGAVKLEKLMSITDENN